MGAGGSAIDPSRGRRQTMRGPPRVRRACPMLAAGGHRLSQVSETRALLLGGCLLHGPLLEYGRRHIDVRAYPQLSFAAGELYALEEMIQFVSLVRGEISIPPDNRRLAAIAGEFEPSESMRHLDAVNVALVEPGTASHFALGDFVLNRRAIITEIIDPIRRTHPEDRVARLTSVWLNKGLTGGDRATQTTLGREMASLHPAQGAYGDLIREVLIEVRAEISPIEQSLAELRVLIDRPIGMVTFTFQYMEDGEPISWPAGFIDDILAASRGLGLPVFEPRELVRQVGVATAMEPDRRHYQRSFLVPMGAALVDFTSRIGKDASM